MASSGHGQDLGAGWVTREGLTPVHQFEQADTALQGALADWLFGPAGSSVPATAPVTGQGFTLALAPGAADGGAQATISGESLALTQGAASARSGAVATVAGQAMALGLGAVSANAGETPAPLVVVPFAGPGRVRRRPLLTPDDLPRLFPEPAAVAAVARVAPLTHRLQLAGVVARGDARAAVAGLGARQSLAPGRAHGIHNPTDEELLAWLAAA